MLPFADLIKASDEDLAPFQFARDAERAARIAYGQQGKGMFVLTQGASETVLFVGDTVLRSTPPSVVEVRDTVGAGDTFYAALLHAFGAMVLRFANNPGCRDHHRRNGFIADA